MSAPPAITIDHVSKRFRWHRDKRQSLKERVFRGRSEDKYLNDFWALKDISLEIPAGKTYGLVGHNGSGKSTLLKLIAGIHRPTSGTIASAGRISALLEIGAGFHPELTGRENVYLNGAILGLSRKQIDERIDEITDFSGIGEFIDVPVKVYSSGMYVRLGFSIAVTVDPEILIVDEIVAVGDEEFQRKCFDHLHELRRRGTTIVIVTHALPLVESLCDTAAWLDHGNLVAVDDGRTIVRRYLDAVNQGEAEAHALADPGDLVEQAPGATRSGSGEARVTQLEFLDRFGHPVSAAVTGEPITFRLHYEAHEPIREPLFGLGVFHESGVNVAGPNSRAADIGAELRGRGYVDFHMPALTLLPGSYDISTCIQSKGHVFDLYEHVFFLKVRPGGNEEPGLVRLEGTWSANGTHPTFDVTGRSIAS